MDNTAGFMAERERLLRIATGILRDPAEAEDVVQQAWIRLSTTDSIESIPAWLTTVTTRLCLDRLRARVPLPVAEEALRIGDGETTPDPADQVAMAETVGLALQVVLDRLTPAERVAFVLHDTFGFDFATISSLLDTTPAAARKLASRARGKVVQPRAERPLADWEIVDAFLSAARHGDFERLIQLLAPDAGIAADSDAVAAGTPERIDGRQQVAEFFNGAAKAALPAFVEGKPGAAWFLHGEAKVAFDFTVEDDRISLITFRANPEVVARIKKRREEKTETDPPRKDDQ